MAVRPRLWIPSSERNLTGSGAGSSIVDFRFHAEAVASETRTVVRRGARAGWLVELVFHGDTEERLRYVVWILGTEKRDGRRPGRLAG
jgi:hypothetical protein